LAEDSIVPTFRILLARAGPSPLKAPGHTGAGPAGATRNVLGVARKAEVGAAMSR